MANKKAAEKSISQTITHTLRNRAVRSKLKTLSKKVVSVGTDADSAKKAAIEYVSELDKAVKKGVIHCNAANRKKSSFSKVIFG